VAARLSNLGVTFSRSAPSTPLALAFHAGRVLGGEPEWESAPELGGCGLL